MNTMTELDPTLDFVHVPACEATKPCSNPADWLGYTTCVCRLSRYACDHHKRRQEAFIAARSHVVHDPCGYGFAPDENPVLWVPLGGTA